MADNDPKGLFWWPTVHVQPDFRYQGILGIVSRQGISAGASTIMAPRGLVLAMAHHANHM